MAPRGPRSSLLARAPFVLGVVLVAYVVLTVPPLRSGGSFRPLVDGWLQCLLYVAAAGACGTGLVVRRAEAGVWGWLVAALVGRAAGFILFVGVVRRLDPPPYPSLADGAWLLSGVCLTVALVRLAAGASVSVSAGLLLDGIRCAAAVAAVMTALYYDDLTGAMSSSTPTRVVLTNLAYPLLDVVILVVVVAALVAHDWHPPAPVWALCGGIAAFAVLDVVYLVQVTSGAFTPGSWLSALSACATALIACAVWLPGDARRPVEATWLPSQVIPAALAVVCWTVLAVAAFSAVPTIAVVLASIGLLAAFARTTLTFGLLRQAARDRRDARVDDLTGLCNRRAYFEELEAALADRTDRRPFTVLTIDCGNLARLAEDHGRLASDEVLRRLGRRLSDGTTRHDTVARIADAEFAVLLDATGKDAASEVAGRLSVSLGAPVHVGDQQLSVAPTVGLATHPVDGTDPLELLHQAELVMLNRRTAHSGRRVGTGTVLRSTTGSRRSVDRVRQAIAEGQLLPHYQPVVELGTGRVVGVEALVRWSRPGSPLLYPDEFLPVVEAGGLMPELTRAVLTTSLRQAAAWQAGGDAGPDPVSVAVNVSVTSLLDRDFTDLVSALLREVGLPGSALHLELTEELFLADPVRAHEAITDLGAMGVKVLIDDYGTGYSTLRYVRDFADIAGLKLDKSFIAPLSGDPRTQAIVRSTLALAESLGLVVVAEGVENATTRDLLLDLGCPLAQGYLFSRPVPPADVTLGNIAAPRTAPG